MRAAVTAEAALSVVLWLPPGVTAGMTPLTLGAALGSLCTCRVHSSTLRPPLVRLLLRMAQDLQVLFLLP